MPPPGWSASRSTMSTDLCRPSRAKGPTRTCSTLPWPTRCLLCVLRSDCPACPPLLHSAFHPVSISFTPSLGLVSVADLQPCKPPQTFILSEVIFCIIPVLVFLAFAGSVFFVAIGAALVFTLFLSGLALLLLVPALFLASAVAATVSVWAVGSFLVAQWLYNVLQQGETTSTLETKIDGGGSREAVKMGPSGIKVDVLGGV
ncbi:hypothetical protein B0T24DRAFT_638124 [Lasiosphaeria ovina]|uniref:Uncharacterized protein n=1 Tax=Lasiosphaeria ovina TaxID=92902 RepID=A0AAE0JY03_9PEZI|nr:hypothetical protein B0T24DRAFT_638124 [Lasiosphaeria ovina]